MENQQVRVMAWTVNSPLEKATMRHLMGVQVLTDTLDRLALVHLVILLQLHIQIHIHIYKYNVPRVPVERWLPQLS